MEELESEFNSGKMQYAFVSITDPNTKMTKYLLIIWVCVKIVMTLYKYFSFVKKVLFLVITLLNAWNVVRQVLF